MKKIAMIIMAVFCTLIGSAHCEGLISVTEENFIEFERDTGYYLAKLENTGTTPIALDTGTLVLFDGNNGLLATSEYVHSYPSYIVLNPGEYTYAYDFIWNDALEDDDVETWMFSMGSDNNGRVRERVECEAHFEFNGDYDNYVYVTFTNSSDSDQYGISIVVALHDSENKLVFVDGMTLDNVGVASKSTITYKFYIDSDYMDYFSNNNISVESADAVVYLAEKE